MGCERKSLVSEKVWALYDTLLHDDAVKKALQYLEDTEPETIAHQVRLCETPAPSFSEKARADYLADQLEKAGMENVYLDEVWNVYSQWPGSQGKATLYACAHMDTVFDGINEIHAELREDGKYYAPGIADNARGMAAIIAVANALHHAGLRTVHNLKLCGSVCEECNGNMRGSKTMFANHRDIDGFLAVDGAGLKMIYQGLGGNRYRVTFHGPGGHSYMHFGTPNAIHAMGRAIAKIDDIQVPDRPKTTFAVGVVEGGTAITAIASEATMFVDLRSEDSAEMKKLEQGFQQAVDAAVQEENRRWNTDTISAEVEMIGDTPSGTQSIHSVMVQTALGATYSLGQTPDLWDVAGGTDANVPLSLGIPAIHMSAGGFAMCGHSVNEWFDPTNSHYGPQSILLAILALAGVEGLSEPLLSLEKN